MFTVFNCILHILVYAIHYSSIYLHVRHPSKPTLPEPERRTNRPIALSTGKQKQFGNIDVSSFFGIHKVLLLLIMGGRRGWRQKMTSIIAINLFVAFFELTDCQ